MRLHHAIGLLPFAFSLGGLAFADRVHPFVFGLPFFLAWTIAGALLCAAAMACVYCLDPANRGPDE
ncbi:DUF3311 domain-containing protein [Piscinibacter gummiphilus]|uniref:Uncharacterized protein n=1 Tax=Piscinibacter gummiphilus TaxID=946333 RepID=A0A1W6L359_9BURK|nr:DUF3311 domain-containing protein [Piscinibacter gummiphilus]ARN18704.1 hypothetical protein A4W93_01530 [Piscinibacter gummiphilus]ATU63342.1 DUF3311 domain-containing protein [Piscinibacter gummiphilus]GLS95852.1 putative membrane protein YhjC [Piscinibacter gummiphilus]